MIVVDTSVWVDAVRRPKGATQSTLKQLIDADEVGLALPVRLELMAGIARKDRRAFARALSGLPILVPTEETWRLIEPWVSPAADKGQRFGVTDLLIAGLAHDVGALVWSLDADFDRLEALGLVQTYVGPSS
ncbi:MAG: PIN domain-containing protein [Vicinamibacterales bacterium]